MGVFIIEIQINPKPIAVVILNLKKFKEDFCKEFNLKNAVLENITFESCDLDEERIKKFLYQSMDWGNIFKLFNVTRQDETVIKVYRCELKGFTTYIPDEMDTGKNKLTLKEKVEDKVDFLVVNTFNPKLDAHIEYMLAANLIDYVNFDWKKIIYFEEENGGSNNSKGD